MCRGKTWQELTPPEEPGAPFEAGCTISNGNTGDGPMSYLILARKYRPQRFSDVVGQDHVTVTLRKAVEKERLAHAYLFAGPRGCGKTSAARLLAKVINCERPADSEPCNECASCTAVIDGRHLDVIEIDGASNRGIDEIRDLREKIGYTPSQGRAKIYIIDEVHMLTPQAFNALLKTLEEPPEHVYLIFATTEPHKVPATILSRCQRFNFKRLELGELVDQLEKICSLEKIECRREALVLMSRRADGSMRDAESLLDQCISAAEGAIDLELVRRVLGLVDSQLIIRLLDCIGARDRREVLGIIDSVVSSGLDLEEFFLAYIEGLRNLLVLSIDGAGSGEWLDITDTEKDELARIAGLFRTEDLLYLFRSASLAFRQFKGASQPRYHLEAAVTEAASWESAVELSKLIERLEAMGGGGSDSAGGGGSLSMPPGRSERGGSSRPGGSAARPETHAETDGGAETADSVTHPEEPSHAQAAEQRHDASLGELGGKQQWERFLAQVREAKLTLGIWLMSAEVKAVRGDRLILGFSPQNRFAREMVREEKNKRYIELHLERFFGRKLIVDPDESVEEESKTAKSKTSETDKKQRRELDPRLEKLADEAPMVKRLIEEFDGVLVREDQASRRIGE